MSKKQYGLIIPNKKEVSAPVARPSIFDDDSDSEFKPMVKPTGSSKTKMQDVISQQKALEEDPTVYQYDELYDEMENKKKESKLARKDIDRKPKYISKLLAAADRRKRENERRIERQVQKEREAEGEEFIDKESFVTSAYKKKLEEMKELEEQEKREEYLEAIGDVKKQGNLDGFYRHLYDQKLNFEDKLSDSEEKTIKVEEDDDDSEYGQTQANKTKTESGEKDEKEANKISKKSVGRKRKYRTRDDSISDKNNADSDTENVEIKKEHLPFNLDADSDFSVDSSSDDEESDKPKEKKSKDDKVEHEGEVLKLPAKGNVLSDNAALLKKMDDKTEDPPTDKTEEDIKEEPPAEEVKPKKPKIDIWKKRTVGEVYDEAVKRYFERKNSRGW